MFYTLHGSMKKNLQYFIAALVAGFSLYSFVSATCAYSDIWFYECTENRDIALSENIWWSTTLSEISLDVWKIDMPPPKECLTPEYCYEETSMVVVIRKTWKPVLAVINNEAMPPSEFAEKFRDVQSTGILTNDSPLLDKVIFQKTLFNRWLIDKVTGKFWYLTELAVMKLQCIKWFVEYNETKTMFEVWPLTIKEVNNLKDRMKEEEYLAKTKLPDIDIKKCGKEFSQRETAIERLMQDPPSRASISYPRKAFSDPSLIWDGVVSLKKE